MTLEAAPEDILKLVSCTCRSNCSTSQCSCKKSGLACTRLYKVCEGLTCLNSEHEEEEPMLIDLEDLIEGDSINFEGTFSSERICVVAVTTAVDICPVICVSAQSIAPHTGGRGGGDTHVAYLSIITILIHYVPPALPMMTGSLTPLLTDRTPAHTITGHGLRAGITRYLASSPTQSHTTRRSGYESPDITPWSLPRVDKGFHDGVPDATVGMGRSSASLRVVWEVGWSPEDQAKEQKRLSLCLGKQEYTGAEYRRMDITHSRKRLILWPYANGLTGRRCGASFPMTSLTFPAAELRCGSQLHLTSRVTSSHRNLPNISGDSRIVTLIRGLVRTTPHRIVKVRMNALSTIRPRRLLRGLSLFFASTTFVLEILSISLHILRCCYSLTAMDRTNYGGLMNNGGECGRKVLANNCETYDRPALKSTQVPYRNPTGMKDSRMCCDGPINSLDWPSRPSHSSLYHLNSEQILWEIDNMPSSALPLSSSYRHITPYYGGPTRLSLQPSDRSRYFPKSSFSFGLREAEPDPVPEPQLNRESGSTGDGTQYLWICIQEL
uniref:Uncharacterized protein n=1 Tax=Timema bartmani TaxID=61472 RepID=A0A7R9EXH0_9NEOP|nr:unnamed protein product [Timema bartmani]